MLVEPRTGARLRLPFWRSPWPVSEPWGPDAGQGAAGGALHRFQGDSVTPGCHLLEERYRHLLTNRRQLPYAEASFEAGDECAGIGRPQPAWPELV